MTKGKFQYYDSKFDELIKTLRDKSNVSTESDADPKPQVFFSYTWVNSAQAVTLGTRYTIYFLWYISTTSNKLLNFVIF
jgi:hypothetical protein